MSQEAEHPAPQLSSQIGVPIRILSRIQRGLVSKGGQIFQIVEKRHTMVDDHVFHHDVTVSISHSQANMFNGVILNLGNLTRRQSVLQSHDHTRDQHCIGIIGHRFAPFNML
jgi:hypothetical protein